MSTLDIYNKASIDAMHKEKRYLHTITINNSAGMTRSEYYSYYTGSAVSNNTYSNTVKSMSFWFYNNSPMPITNISQLVNLFKYDVHPLFNVQENSWQYPSTLYCITDTYIVWTEFRANTNNLYPYIERWKLTFGTGATVTDVVTEQ